MQEASKTEPPTPKRRQESRADGTFARSRDANTLAATIAVLIYLSVYSSDMARWVAEFAEKCFTHPFDIVNRDMDKVYVNLAILMAKLTIPPGLCAVGGAVLVGFLQAGWAPSWKLVGFKLSRLNPIPKIVGLFSFRPDGQAAELAIQLARVTILGLVVYSVLKDAFPVLTHLASGNYQDGLKVQSDVLTKVIVRCIAVMALLSLVDYAKNWWQVEKSLKMTKEEVKDEAKQSEGDPAVKARIRSKGRERLRKGIMQKMMGASVVLTNPTHVSVALRYHPDEGAPTVVAKGYDDVALFIREIAKKLDVQIVESPPLARELAKRVRVGRQIPVDLYGAVAEVLAFVYRVRGKAPWEKAKPTPSRV